MTEEMDSLTEMLLNTVAPQVGGYFGDIEDFHHRCHAYFAMKWWWDKLNGGKRDVLSTIDGR